MSPRLLRTAARGAGVTIAICVAILAADWAVATSRAPKDDKAIKAFQKQVREDPAVAPKFAAEYKRITSARLSRKVRDRSIAWVLIASAALFLACVKRLLALRPRNFVAMSKLTAAPAPVRKRRSKGKATVPPAAADSGIDLGFVDEMVARHGKGREAAIPLLQAIQSHYRYLPDDALRRICALTEITPAEIAGTSSFYGQFRTSPVGKHMVRVCHGTACHVAGARQITDELRRHLKIPEGQDTDAARMFTLGEVACLGCCSLAPVLMVDEHTAARLTPSTAAAALDEVEQKEPA